ncbi:MAG: TMEM165/GDT1 family protein [Candidatus Rokubacteria bacterium]|nr:TMEM165/GDT1 family protein [Candidatus Rokubacteria bacterium]
MGAISGPPSLLTLTTLAGSFAVVALAEMGDKTQLVALALGLRYRRPWTVLLGVLLATLANHALAATLGAAAAARVDERVLGWIVGLGFIVFGVWTLVPDEAGAAPGRDRWGPLLTTTIVFFFAEMGDKTQLATVALAARFPSPIVVTAGTTAGMLAADGLALFAGARLAARVPLSVFRRVAAALFFAFGAASILAAHIG